MDKRKKKGKIAKIFPFLITFIILGVLILSGPAQAFALDVSIPKTTEYKGNEMSFLVSLNIDTGERLPVDSLRWQLSGPDNIDCQFFPNGTKISGCDYLDIQKISDTAFNEGNLTGNYSSIEYNWGYGFGNEAGSLIYNMTLNTLGMSEGVYATEFELNIGGNQFTENGADITIVAPISNLTVYSPTNTVYNIRDIPLNITLEGTSSASLFYSDNGGAELALCTNCNYYGFNESITRRFADGPHTLKIIGRAGGEEVSRVIDFTVDTTYPRIRRTEPRIGFADGMFEVEVEEINSFDLWLNYGTDLTGYRNKKVDVVNDCYDLFQRKVCNATTNLVDYDGQEIKYWFNISDVTDKTTKSFPIKLKVDDTPPQINNPTSFWSQGVGVDNRKISFSFDISEKNRYQINYRDSDSLTQNWIKICEGYQDSTCENLEGFDQGHHVVEIQAIDENNNFIIETINFDVVY